MVNVEQLYEIFKQHPIICTDTRTIIKGALFFALKGENFDANTFAEKALAQGAAFVIIDNQDYFFNNRCILVNDVLTALQDLARLHRKNLKIPVIGLTGSNGKTTTKELIQAVLSKKFNSFATKGNLNNHIGVPLSILAIKEDIEIAIIEMGANHQKEIEFLCGIAQPTHGLITNVGLAHLDGFGGFEGVKKGKGELFKYIAQHFGVAFINRDNLNLMEMNKISVLNEVVYYGTEENNTVSGTLKNCDPYIELEWKADGQVNHASANLTGTYNFENVLAAICIGHYFKLQPVAINKGLANYFPSNNRSQITKTENNTVICDFYNANPSSMSGALNNLKALKSNHKTAIIGSMFELGEESQLQHKLIAKLAQESNIDTLIFIGKDFNCYANEFDGHFFITPAEAKAYLEENPIKNSLVLLKGSRGLALEQILPLL